MKESQQTIQIGNRVRLIAPPYLYIPHGEEGIIIDIDDSKEVTEETLFLVKFSLGAAWCVKDSLEIIPNES